MCIRDSLYEIWGTALYEIWGTVEEGFPRASAGMRHGFFAVAWTSQHVRDIMLEGLLGLFLLRNCNINLLRDIAGYAGIDTHGGAYVSES